MTCAGHVPQKSCAAINNCCYFEYKKKKTDLSGVQVCVNINAFKYFYLVNELSYTEKTKKLGKEWQGGPVSTLNFCEAIGYDSTLGEEIINCKCSYSKLLQFGAFFLVLLVVFDMII